MVKIGIAQCQYFALTQPRYRSQEIERPHNRVGPMLWLQEFPGIVNREDGSLCRLSDYGVCYFKRVGQEYPILSVDDARKLLEPKHWANPVMWAVAELEKELTGAKQEVQTAKNEQEKLLQESKALRSELETLKTESSSNVKAWTEQATIWTEQAKHWIDSKNSQSELERIALTATQEAADARAERFAWGSIGVAIGLGFWFLVDLAKAFALGLWR